MSPADPKAQEAPQAGEAEVKEKQLTLEDVISATPVTEPDQAKELVKTAVEEAIKGNRVVKLFGGQGYENKRFDTITNRVRHMNLKIIATSAANVPAVQMIAVIALAIMIYIASSQTLENEFTVGSFISFFGAMGLLFSPIKRLTKVNEQLQRGMAASQSIFELLEQPPEPETGNLRMPAIRGALSFRHVSLRYDTDKIAALDDVSLDIEPGETVALVGKSGSGKSSLAALVPLFDAAI